MRTRMQGALAAIGLAALATTGVVAVNCGALAAAPAEDAPAADLAAGFAAPPASAGPYTWWHWMNGNVTAEGITLDLEAMKRVGIAGFQIFDVGTGIPQGPVVYLSPEWLKLMQHAASEADRLGLEFDMHNCPGWSSSGGPWITPEYAMQNLVWSETSVDGGQAVDVALPRPNANLDYYRDALVLAFPAPADGIASIANWQTKSNAGGGGGFGTRGARPAAAPPEAAAAAADPDSVVDISQFMDPEGRLSWQAPAGDWIVLRLGYTPTGRQNVSAPSTGQGLECDKYSRAGIEFHFKNMFEELLPSLAPLAAKGLAGSVIDSYETGLQNWTAAFPEEFQKRRGYDLRKYLPAMTGRMVGSEEISDRFLWDVRRTQADLMADNYYGRFAELCRENGLRPYIEPYDPGPFEEMQVGSRADVPMGEFWQGQAIHHSVKLVASVAHVNGRPVVGAESFTSQSRWTEYPYSLKALGDNVYTLGVNRYIFHRFALQPHPTAVPGMTMGPWGGHFDRTNTWWEQGEAWIQYITRCQYMLQQGLFVADLLYLTNQSAPGRAPDRGALSPAVPQGHDFDTVGAETLLTRAKVEDGRIVLPDGMSYRVMVLPNAAMTPEVLGKVRDMVRQGMVLVVTGQKPSQSPSLVGYPACDAEVRLIADELWGDLDAATVTERTLGKGRVFWGQPLRAVLDKLGVKPDFEFAARAGDAQINCIHRRIGQTEVYFVANRRGQSEDLVCTFAVEGKRPEFWYADTGGIAPAEVYELVDGRVRLPLRLDPAGSVFVVFRSAAPAQRIQAVLKDGVVVAAAEPFPAEEKAAESAPRGGRGGGFGGFQSQAITMPNPEEPPSVELAAGPKGEMLIWQNGAYAVRDSAGKTSSVQVSAISPPVEIAGPWRVAFPPDRGAPPEVTLGELISWTEHSEDGVKYFSGTATYTKRINVPADATAGGKRLYLDLGQVQVIAEVLVNGRNVGILWKPPFRVDITDAVRPGENELEIRITNLWPNRLIGDELLPAENQYGGGGRGGRGGAGAIAKLPEWYAKGQPKPPGGRTTFSTWQHYTKDSPLLPSGLIGPVRLRTAVLQAGGL